MILLSRCWLGGLDWIIMRVKCSDVSNDSDSDSDAGSIDFGSDFEE